MFRTPITLAVAILSFLLVESKGAGGVEAFGELEECADFLLADRVVLALHKLKGIDCTIADWKESRFGMDTIQEEVNGAEFKKEVLHAYSIAQFHLTNLSFHVDWNGDRGNVTGRCLGHPDIKDDFKALVRGVALFVRQRGLSHTSAYSMGSLISSTVPLEERLAGIKDLGRKTLVARNPSLPEEYLNRPSPSCFFIRRYLDDMKDCQWYVVLDGGVAWAYSVPTEDCLHLCVLCDKRMFTASSSADGRQLVSALQETHSRLSDLSSWEKLRQFNDVFARILKTDYGIDWIEPICVQDDPEEPVCTFYP